MKIRISELREIINTVLVEAPKKKPVVKKGVRGKPKTKKKVAKKPAVKRKLTQLLLLQRSPG